MDLSLHCWPAGVRSDSESRARATLVWHEEENLPGTVEVEEKKGRSCVYNRIMEPKRSKYVCRRILLTGFTLYVALGEYISPVWVRVPFIKANIWHFNFLGGKSG